MIQQQEKEKPNIQYMAKGALIIGVIAFHSFLYEDHAADHHFHIAFCVFPCQMGVFFFYSGFNYASGKRSPIDNIKRRAKQILIPLITMFFVAVILIGGLQLITGNTQMIVIWYSIKYLLTDGGVMTGNPDLSKGFYDLSLAIGELWYLYALYIVSVVFYLIVDWTISKLRNLLIIVIPLLITSFLIGQFIGYCLPYTVQSYPLILAIMLVGAYIRKKDLLNIHLDNKKNIYISIILMIVFEGIIIGLCLLCYYAFGATAVGALISGGLNQKIRGFDVFVAFLMSILGTFVIHTLMKFISKIKFVSSFFEIFGKNSALVYLTHPILLSYIHTLIFWRNNDLFGWL